MTVTTTLKALALVTVLGVCLAEPALAAQDALGEALVAQELRGLADSIDNLARQLNEQSRDDDRAVRLRELDIAISYLNFRSRRIEMFERELQSTKANRNRLSDLLEQFDREEEGLAQMFDSSQPDERRRAAEEIDMRRQVIKNRISRMDEEIIMLENRIMDMQSQIDNVENFVERNLEF